MRFISPKTDFAFKKIFGSAQSKPILISFLNALIYQGNPMITDLEIIDPYQSGQNSELKDSYLDVKARLNDGKLVIIEMQVLNIPGFEKRILYNTAKAYGNQLNVGRRYGELNPVISLTIADFNIFNNTNKFISTFIFKEEEELFDYRREMSLIFVELPKFNKSLEELTSIADKWIYFIKQAPDLQVVPDSLGTITEINMALTIANQANLTTEELDQLDSKMFFLEDQRKLAEERQRIETESQRIETESQRIESESQRIEAESQRMKVQQRELILLRITQILGNLEFSIANQITQLSMEQLLDLGDALLDFNEVSDLNNWLQNLTI